MIRLINIEKESLETLWPLTWPYLAGAILRSRGRFSDDGVRNLLETGAWLLWAAIDDVDNKVFGVAVTEILRYPSGKKIVNIPICTGVDASKWTMLISELEKWAVSEGAASIQAWARRGWAKRLPDYEMTHVLLEKELSDGR